MAEEPKVDLMAKLPDEVLKEVFDRLPSLGDKLRVEESVSHRFQRCLIELLTTKPIPFDAKWGKLNGYSVSWDEMPGAIKCLAKKAKFSNIDIYVREGHGEGRCVDPILTALVDSETDCLSKVSVFQINSDLDGGWCSETPLKEVFAKCPKLSDVRLDFNVRPLNTDNDATFLVLLPVTSPVLDLGVVLHGKALTGLDLSLHRYTQEQVTQVFQSIQPDMLQTLSLRLSKMALDMEILVTELGGGAWAALEELNINFLNSPILRLDVIFSPHFLAHLPAIRKCNYAFGGMYQYAQLVAPLISLFANQMEINVTIDPTIAIMPHHETGCQIVALIRQVQAIHPDLQVGFGPDGDELTLTLDNVSFEQHLHAMVPSCNAENCAECGIFYPSLFWSLGLRADRRADGTQQDVHLANGRLDRCRVYTIVEHLNRDVEHLLFGRQWTALHAEMNEGHNMATITFETEEAGQHNQFQITVHCGHCLDNACFGCLHVG